MNFQDFAPIPAARLKRVRWRGELAYRILSYSFAVRWNRALTADHVRYVFGGFAVPRSEGAPKGWRSTDGTQLYSLVDLGPREPRQYRLVLGDKQLMSSRKTDDILNHLVWEISTRMPERTEDFLLIHAGSVVSPRGEGVLLPAPAGSGKTTLVTGLIRAGFKFLSDEVGVIDRAGATLHPYPRALNFKDGAEEILPDLRPSHVVAPFGPGNRYVRAEDIRAGVMANPCEVRFVVFPRYEKGAATQITPLSPAATVKELWANAMNLRPFGGRALPILAAVAGRARGYRLLSGDLPDAVRAISEITQAG